MSSVGRWQRFLLVFCVLQLIWAVAGLIANPDFAVGYAATSVRVLGVDFNGWHAVSGFLLFGPGLIAFRRDELALPYTWAAVAALLITAGWTLFSIRPVWVFYFPNPAGDILLHLGSAAVLLFFLVIRQWDRPPVAA